MNFVQKFGGVTLMCCFGVITIFVYQVGDYSFLPGVLLRGLQVGGPLLLAQAVWRQREMLEWYF